MKLTKEARAQLRRVLYNAEAANAYIHDDRTAVCLRKASVTTTLDYLNTATGKALCEVEKAYGSPLCQLEEAIKVLGAFLATH